MGDSAIISAAAGLLGALVGGGAAIWAANVAANASERATVAKEGRDEKRRTEEAVAKARGEAAREIIEDLESMRDAWSSNHGSPIDDAERTGRLWDLHERVRVRALILPSDLRQEIAVLNRSLRFADELGGDGFRPGGFIFLGTRGVAQLAYETAEERLSRYIAGDVAVPWSADALRLRAAHDDLMSARESECAAEVHEYESERSEFDARHPSLSGEMEAANRLRGSAED